jgi:hypothetical protein
MPQAQAAINRSLDGARSRRNHRRGVCGRVCIGARVRTSVENPVRDQWKPIFGTMYRRLTAAEDWESISDQKRAERLRDLMKAEDKMHGRPSRFGDDFDFLSVVRYLGNP